MGEDVEDRLEALEPSWRIENPGAANVIDEAKMSDCPFFEDTSWTLRGRDNDEAFFSWIAVGDLCSAVRGGEYSDFGLWEGETLFGAASRRGVEGASLGRSALLAPLAGKGNSGGRPLACLFVLNFDVFSTS